MSVELQKTLPGNESKEESVECLHLYLADWDRAGSLSFLRTCKLGMFWVMQAVTQQTFANTHILWGKLGVLVWLNDENEIGRFWVFQGSVTTWLLVTFGICSKLSEVLPSCLLALLGAWEPITKLDLYHLKQKAFENHTELIQLKSLLPQIPFLWICLA